MFKSKKKINRGNYALFIWVVHHGNETSLQNNRPGVPIVAQGKQIWLVSMRTQVRALDSLHGLRIRHCRELWYSLRCCSDLVLLWLWCKLTARAPIRPLAWEPPYATGAALKRPKKKKKSHQQQWAWGLQPAEVPFPPSQRQHAKYC